MISYYKKVDRNMTQYIKHYENGMVTVVYKSSTVMGINHFKWLTGFNECTTSSQVEFENKFDRITNHLKK